MMFLLEIGMKGDFSDDEIEDFFTSLVHFAIQEAEIEAITLVSCRDGYVSYVVYTTGKEVCYFSDCERYPFGNGEEYTLNSVYNLIEELKSRKKNS